MNLRALRTAKGLTQDRLSQASGLSQASISSLENGQVPNPQADTLEALARVLDTDLVAVLAAIRASVAEAAAA